MLKNNILLVIVVSQLVEKLDPHRRISSGDTGFSTTC
jgi:hypothetical protein